MKIKLLISRVGRDFSQNSGDVIEVDDDQGKRMIDAGQAIRIVEEKPKQRAVRKPREKR